MNIKKLWIKIYSFIMSWTNWSRENPTNFTKFVAASASLTFLFRYLLIWCLSEVAPVINKLFFIASISAIFSIVIFYIKFYYSKEIKSALKPVINVDRISSNLDKNAYILSVVKKDNPELKFWVQPLILPLMLIFICSNRVSPEFETAFMFIISSLFFFYTAYMLKIRRALVSVNISADKIPIPSKPIVSLWHFIYLVRANTSMMLRGPHGTGGGVVFKTTAEYMSSPEFQQKAKTLATTITITSGVLAAIAGVEAGVCHLIDHTTPSYILSSTVLRGFYTPHPLVRQRFSEIQHAIPEDKIKTYIIPGTKILDPKAVNESYKELKNWENDYTTKSPMPDLEGPHSKPTQEVPTETKETSLDDILSFE